MKIVVDTNVLVSGLITPFGNSAEIVRMISSGELILLYDSRIISEYEEVLTRPKFKFDEKYVLYLIEQLEYIGVVVASSPLLICLPDRDDEPFLEVAISGRADCLVTGNRVHFPKKSCQGVKICSPKEFLTLYQKKQNF